MGLVETDVITIQKALASYPATGYPSTAIFLGELFGVAKRECVFLRELMSPLTL